LSNTTFSKLSDLLDYYISMQIFFLLHNMFLTYYRGTVAEVITNRRFHRDHIMGGQKLALVMMVAFSLLALAFRSSEGTGKGGGKNGGTGWGNGEEDGVNNTVVGTGGGNGYRGLYGGGEGDGKGKGWRHGKGGGSGDWEGDEEDGFGNWEGDEEGGSGYWEGDGEGGGGTGGGKWCINEERSTLGQTNHFFKY